MEEALAYIFNPFAIYTYTAAVVMCQLSMWLVAWSARVPRECRTIERMAFPA